MTAFLTIMLSPVQTILVVAIALIGLIALINILTAISRRKKSQRAKIELENQRFLERITPVPDTQKYDLSPSAMYVNGDYILSRNVTYGIGGQGQPKAGRYLILSSQDGVEEMNVRINGIVRSVKHNDSITLAEGDTICPVSHSIVLR